MFGNQTFPDGVPLFRQQLVFILQAVKVVVDATLVEQLLMGTCFANPALVNYYYFISMLDRRKAVGDNNSGPARASFFSAS